MQRYRWIILDADGTLFDYDQAELSALTGTFRQHSRFGASSLKPYFSSLVISDEIGVAKPEPGYFSEVLSRAGNPKRAEVLMVGDGLSSDIAGGVR